MAVPGYRPGISSQYSSAGLYSLTAKSYIFSFLNSRSVPTDVALAGILPPGDYSLGTGTGFGGVVNVGASNETHSGSLSNFLFTVQVPEPSCIALGGVMGAMGFRQRR